MQLKNNLNDEMLKVLEKEMNLKKKSLEKERNLLREERK